MTTTLPRPFAHGAARIGLLAKGFMYLLLGVVIARLAWPGESARAADKEGALRTLAAQPAGRALLAALAVGIAAYAVWQWRCAITGDDTWARVTAGLRGLLWTGLAFTAARVVFGAATGGDSAESMTAELLNAPFGVWLVVAAGAGIVIAGVVMLRRLRGNRFLKHLRPLPQQTRRMVTVAARIGITARSLVYVLIGAFLVRAALTHNPDRGVGLDGALSQVARAPYGSFMLAFAAVGLAAYAVWCLVRARYEDLDSSKG